jgi:hypothetical protein
MMTAFCVVWLVVASFMFAPFVSNFVRGLSRRRQPPGRYSN